MNPLGSSLGVLYGGSRMEENTTDLYSSKCYECLTDLYSSKCYECLTDLYSSKCYECLTSPLFQTTKFRLFQSERVCRRQFQM